MLDLSGCSLALIKVGTIVIVTRLRLTMRPGDPRLTAPLLSQPPRRRPRDRLPFLVGRSDLGSPTERRMTDLPSPAEAAVVAQRLKPARRRHQIGTPSRQHGWLAPVLLGSAAALGAAALYTAKQTREAERKHPPVGRFLEVDGVRLHYIEQGTGEPLALIHGNGTLIQDFTVNGLVDRLSERYRVIVIERPGYGYSDRPRGLWTPRAHATLYEHALR